jgi:hypothetical protein
MVMGEQSSWGSMVLSVERLPRYQERIGSIVVRIVGIGR